MKGNFVLGLLLTQWLWPAGFWLGVRLNGWRVTLELYAAFVALAGMHIYLLSKESRPL